MKKLLLTIVFSFFCANTANADLRGLPNISILAASSLTEPMTEIIRIYSREKNITVTASYHSTSEQAWRVEEGESADIFISAHPKWMAELKQKGLIDVYSLANIVKNKLALVTSTKSRLNEYPIPGTGLESKLQFLNNRTIMVFGDAENSALGLYTEQALKNFDSKMGTTVWIKIGGNTIKSPSAKSSLYLIAQGETAGIVYYSDALNNEEVRILSVIDEDLHDPIVYQAAVVAGENMVHARDFMTFLQSATSKQILKKHGFITD